YIQYVRENGRQPNSVFKLAQQIGIDEKAFYREYTSFGQIEQEVWAGYFEKTLSQLESEDVYAEYSVREKMLAFFYTLVEHLKADRSFLVGSTPKGNISSKTLETFKMKYREYSRDLIDEGIMREEIEPRAFFSERYPDLLWVEASYVIKFWLKDKTADFESTDAAIEKAVNFSMDLLGRNIADSTIDFVKFFFQNR
ncbi:MAG: TetR family transcriptional regulator C-terminal domain-containing protein, partial [Bacteroidota bacterium]